MLSGTVLVPGITTVASVVFAPFIEKLESIGVKSFTPLDIPSVNPTEALSPNALEADVTSIRTALTEAVERKGLDVVLVGHSYGSVPCLAAAQDLWKTAREQQGKKGGVVKVALVAAPLILTGESVVGLRTEYEKQFGVVEAPPPNLEQTEWGMLLKPTGLGSTFFTDLPASEADHWTSTLRPFALEALTTPTAKVDPAEWNISFLLTENDPVMPIHGQEWMIGRARDLGAKIEVTRMLADHFPFLSHMEETASCLKGVLEEKN